MHTPLIAAFMTVSLAKIVSGLAAPSESRRI